MVTLVLQVLHSLCSGKDMMVKTPIDAKEQPDMAAHTETIVCDVTTVQQTVVRANLADVVASSDDLRLIEQLRSGNEEAFVSLIDRYHTAMLRLAMVYVTARAVAEEVVQETWMGVLQGLGRFEGCSSLKTWMFHILTNCAKTRALREGRSIPFSSLPEVDANFNEPAVDPNRFWSADQQQAGAWVSFPRSWDEIPEERILS